MAFAKILYGNLNARQKENYNFQKVSPVLADFGFTTIRLTDDWQGADFIAQHLDGETFLKVQLKGRLTIDKKYSQKNIFICFRDENNLFYIYPHDEMVSYLIETTNIGNTQSWIQNGLYSMKTIGKSTLEYLRKFAL
jgi:hypothetical protein